MIRRLVALFLLTTCACGSSDSNSNPVVVIKTNKGEIRAELFADKAPITVKNFLTYVDEEHYDGTVFHRVIPTFMIQGGGFKAGFSKAADPDSLKKPGEQPAIKNEASNGLANKRGTLAMARTNQPDSATDQFFINVKDNEGLDRANARDRVGYAVFGKIIAGMDVVDAIKKVPTGSAGHHDDVPVDDVVIESIRRE